VALTLVKFSLWSIGFLGAKVEFGVQNKKAVSWKRDSLTENMGLLSNRGAKAFPLLPGLSVDSLS
jgi:hypothetical protein